MSVSPIQSQPPIQSIKLPQPNLAPKANDPDGDGDVDAARARSPLPAGQGTLVDIDA